MHSGLAAVLTIAFFVATSTRVASAQTSSDSAAADVLFEQGRAALAHGDVKTACEKFEASRRLEPAVGTLLNLGECSAKLERRRAAWVAFREALRFMPASDDRRAYAQERVAELDAKLARLTLTFRGPSSGVRVFVDEEAISPPFDAPRLVDPGVVRVRVEMTGRRPRSFSASAAEGASLTLEISPGDPDSASPPTEEGTGHRTLGFVLAGAGIAIAGAGAAFGVAALDSSADAKSRCGGGVDCPDQNALDGARADAETASTQAAVSTILFAAGALVAGAGIYFIATSMSRSSPSSAALSSSSSMHRARALRFEF